MPRAKPQYLEIKDRNKLLDEFWTTIALLENVGEIKNFFKDLLSETEALMLARRLRIAQLIYAGWSYDQIEKALHTSTATIATVHSWLDGGFGGYIKGIAKLRVELNRQKSVERQKELAQDPSSFEYLKRKYPLHFLLFNAADDIKYRLPRRLRK